MPLRELLTQVRNDYPPYAAAGIVDSNDPLYELVVSTIPRELAGFHPIDPLLLIEGSTGRGNVTGAPWIATFDTRITDTATRGYYPVYLYSLDFKRIYLSIAFGISEFTKLFGQGDALFVELRAAAEKLAVHIEDKDLYRGQLDLAATSRNKLHYGYEQANIAAIEYDLHSLPPTELLRADYLRLLTIYRKLIESPAVPSAESLAIESVQPPPISTPEFLPFAPRPSRKPGKRGTSAIPRRRSDQSTKVGRQAEEIVLKEEEKRLTVEGRSDLTEKIRAHYKNSEFPGWDISSYELSGEERFIEVKGAIEGMSTLELTINEWEAASRHRDKYCLYLVSNVFAEKPTIEILRDPKGMVDRGELSLFVSQYLLDLRMP